MKGGVILSEREVIIEDSIEKKAEEKEELVIPYDFMKYLNYEALASRVLGGNESGARVKYRTFFKYTKEQVLSYLKAPDRNEKNLREASIYLYNTCSFYHRLIDYFSKMLTLGYVVAPSKLDFNKKDTTKLTAAYQKTVNILENMNIGFSFRAPLVTAMREDVSYNYVRETKDSFLFQPLDPDYCKLYSLEDGVYHCSFDFKYFDLHDGEVDLYPSEFKTKYEAYKANNNLRWQQLEVKNTMVLKANFDVPYPIPPMAGVFEAIYDIIDYKSLMLAKTETGNYKVLSMTIPTDSKGNFLIDFETARKFYNQMGQNLPDNIGLALSPMKLDSFDFENASSNKESDMVKSAEQNFWSSAGVSSLNFNNEKSSNNALIQSIRGDESVMWGLLSQIETWVNRYLKMQSGAQKFHISMPQISVYNQKEKSESFLKAAQSGMPTKMLYGASIGLTPCDMMSLNYLENEVLGLNEKLIPLQTSYTMSGDQGRPTNESAGKEITDSGEVAQERGE